MESLAEGLWGFFAVSPQQITQAVENRGAWMACVSGDLSYLPTFRTRSSGEQWKEAVKNANIQDASRGFAP